MLPVSFVTSSDPVLGVMPLPERLFGVKRYDCMLSFVFGFWKIISVGCLLMGPFLLVGVAISFPRRRLWTSLLYIIVG